MAHAIRRLVIVIVALLLILPAGAQQRAKGLSLHMLPMRVAALSGAPWGFTVDRSANVRGTATLQSADSLLDYFRQQSPQLQANGIWIVTTNPDAYSADEKSLLEDVKAMCRRERIALFICRASQLPNGWVRYDQ
jgi:hypothetical protein